MYSIPSAQKANAFLWICHRVLEDKDCAADFLAPDTKLQGFQFAPGDVSAENVDTPEEIAYGAEMASARKEFMGKVQSEKSEKGKITVSRAI